jgi:hypothetical protein
MPAGTSYVHPVGPLSQAGMFDEARESQLGETRGPLGQDSPKHTDGFVQLSDYPTFSGEVGGWESPQTRIQMQNRSRELENNSFRDQTRQIQSILLCLIKRCLSRLCMSQSPVT